MMIKYIIIIFVVLVMSCQSNIISDANMEGDKYGTYFIEKIEPSIEDHLSRYHATTNTDYVHFDNNISFMDRHGKFAIGDTVIVKFVNKSK